MTTVKILLLCAVFLYGPVSSFLGNRYIAWLIRKYNHMDMPKMHEEVGYWIISGWPINTDLIKGFNQRVKPSIERRG